MLFREFQIIAAAAYAAEQAARYVADPSAEPLPLWDQLSETEQGEQVTRVMAVGRGEDIGDEHIAFARVAEAILTFNNGQGGLALERIADLGRALIDLGLVSSEDAEKGGDIVEHAKALLHDLAEERRPAGSGAGPWSSPRFRSLQFAARIDGAIATAQIFLAFIDNGGGDLVTEHVDALELAFANGANGETYTAEQLVAVARTYVDFLHPDVPAAPELPADDGVNGEAVTVQ